MNPKQEELARRVQEARQSSLLNRLYEREGAIISRLVAAYRADTLSSDQLFGGIAAIAELRSMAISVNQDEMIASDIDYTK